MADSGFVDVKPLATSSGEVARDSLSNTFPPSTTDGIFNNLQVGVENYVFHVSEEGLWLGAQEFSDAPFSVAMDGTTVIGGEGGIEGALYQGDAAEDVNTHTTTISGGMITTGTITADQLAVSSVIASKIASGAILSEKIGAGEIKAVNIAAGVIVANHIATKTITGTLMADGTISTLQIASATITGSNIAGGTITGSNIAGGTITGANIAGGTISGANIAGGTISGANIVNATITDTQIGSLSADKLTAGTLYVGYTGRPGVINLNRNGTNGYLTWTGGNKIWSDGSQYMGFTANGERFYFYTGGALYALFQRYSQASFYSGISASGARSYIYGGLTVNDTGATIYGGLYLPEGLTLIGTSSIYAHINCPTTSTYNLGSSTQYWAYVNAYGFRDKGGGFYDTPVKLRSGEEVDDITALKSIKPRKDEKRTDRDVLDVRTFPEGIFVPAADNDGKLYKRNNADIPLVKNEETGIEELRPDADSVDLGEFVALIFGGFKQLVKRVEELEEKLK